ncbi:hypothetical protein AKJ64_01345 [candidate division MSBL1 archaeon SCGC-AAA259E17]|uniref:Uncharacterized protein n=1 Tax=candidate division MSBL1 archaeon SCGC-AAA259E17 TaxID=1698263 RepID=A0A133UG67_9EURY|nr:hypothetical protein AKJ64_01345 [candidate division MSBL1 archaeon SCGC-AAA259E17]
MNEIEGKLSPLQRKIIKRAEKAFSEASEKYCTEKEEGVCGITGEKCGLRSCPKIQEAKRKASGR